MLRSFEVPILRLIHWVAGAAQTPYTFTTAEQLYADFMADVMNWRA
jgi:hypothetical protein